MSDPMDVKLGRWLKSGAGGHRPPEAVRARILRTAASRQVALERRQARRYAVATGGERGFGIDAWSFGLAAQAAMDWFPRALTTLRVAY